MTVEHTCSMGQAEVEGRLSVFSSLFLYPSKRRVIFIRVSGRESSSRNSCCAQNFGHKYIIPSLFVERTKAIFWGSSLFLNVTFWRWLISSFIRSVLINGKSLGFSCPSNSLGLSSKRVSFFFRASLRIARVLFFASLANLLSFTFSEEDLGMFAIVPGSSVLAHTTVSPPVQLVFMSYVR